MSSFRYGSSGNSGGSRTRPTQDFYRDKMLELADARGSALMAEKKKREKMISEMEKEEAGKWGDIAMLGASLGGMIGGAVAPGVGAVPGMGIGAAIGAGLGGLKALTAKNKPGLGELVKGAVPSPMMAAFGGQTMAQRIAADDMRRGRFSPTQQQPGGMQNAQGMMQAMMPMAQMGAMAAGGMAGTPNAGGGLSAPPPTANAVQMGAVPGGPNGSWVDPGGMLHGGSMPVPVQTPPPGWSGSQGAPGLQTAIAGTPGMAPRELPQLAGMNPAQSSAMPQYTGGYQSGAMSGATLPWAGIPRPPLPWGQQQMYAGGSW